jgi:hypothetical protein
MTPQQNNLHKKYGIDEIYVHPGLVYDTLEKLQHRAEFCIDGEDNIVQKHVSHDLVLIFYKKPPSKSFIYRFLADLDKMVNKSDYIHSNTLLNEEDFFEAIKSKSFVLITHRNLIKENSQSD